MKLIIHETDPNGCGTIYFNGREEYYSYEGYFGDIKQSIEALIDVGFINKDDVIVFDENNSIYKIVQDYYEKIDVN